MPQKSNIYWSHAILFLNLCNTKYSPRVTKCHQAEILSIRSILPETNIKCIYTPQNTLLCPATGLIGQFRAVEVIDRTFFQLIRLLS